MYEASQFLGIKYGLSVTGVTELMFIENSGRNVSIEELETVACENKLNEILIDFFGLNESIILEEVDEISKLSWAIENNVTKQHILDIMVFQLEDLTNEMKKLKFLLSNKR